MSDPDPMTEEKKIKNAYAVVIADMEKRKGEIQHELTLLEVKLIGLNAKIELLNKILKGDYDDVRPSTGSERGNRVTTEGE